MWLTVIRIVNNLFSDTSKPFKHLLEIVVYLFFILRQYEAFLATAMLKCSFWEAH